jgi:hypothetical protein
MGRIKSALEIALERSEGIQSDKTAVASYEAKQRGKKAANEFLGGGADLAECIKKAPKEEQQSLKDGAFEVLLAQINLPAAPDDLKRLELVGKGLSAIIGDKRFTLLYQQFSGAINQYLDEQAQYEEALKRQYAPKLRQKEEELARRFGRAVKLDPFQDPEFVAFYNQNISALKANYEGLVDQVREQARLMVDNK